MKNISELDQLTRSTRKREYDDGLVDYIYGLLFLLMGILCCYLFSYKGMRWYLAAYIQNREITILGSLLVFGLLILLVAGSRRLVEKIRQVAIWRHSGFVKPLNRQVRWSIQLAPSAVAISFILIGIWLTLIGVINQEMALRILVASTGIVFVGMGIDLQLGRYQTVGLAGLLFSILPIFFSITFSFSWLIFGITWMIIFVLSGSWALYRFVSDQKVSIHE